MNEPVWLTNLETTLKLLGGIAGLGTLAFSSANILLAQRRPTGTTTGAAPRLLRTRYLVAAMAIFVLAGFFLWTPLPFEPPWLLHLALISLGAFLLFPSLGLYIWGLVSLGENFNASTGFGVRLVRSHRLVTSGPYACIRHPMYLAVILAGWAGLMLYLTWSMLVFAVMMLGLVVRARREEQALAQEFGQAWQEYCNAVPGWLPHLGTKA
jgi:protein-S-isoprenylcysteine O-methyltransferase Ste14